MTIAFESNGMRLCGLFSYRKYSSLNDKNACSRVISRKCGELVLSCKKLVNERSFGSTEAFSLLRQKYSVRQNFCFGRRFFKILLDFCVFFFIFFILWTTGHILAFANFSILMKTSLVSFQKFFELNKF